MKTTFSDLCPELIFELCSYFSISELYHSFYPHCLPHLFDYAIRLHLDLINDDQLTGTLFSLIDINRVSSLRLSSCYIPQMVFISVRALSVYNSQGVHQVISQLSNLPVLERLSLINPKSLTNVIFKQIFACSSLKYLKIQSVNMSIAITGDTLEQSTSIEQLVLNTSCFRTMIESFLTRLPNLRSLRVRILFERRSTSRSNRFAVMNVISPSIIRHSSLQTVNFVWYHPTMIDIITLLTGLSNLKQCQLSGVMNCEELNGKLWYDLLMGTCRNLQKMNVNMLVWTGDRGEEIQTNFDEDNFFNQLDFALFPNDDEKKSFVFFGDFQRVTQ